MPGSGAPAAQVRDFNGGILGLEGCSGPCRPTTTDLQLSRDARRAVLELRDVPVLDSFQFFGPNQVPASISMRVEWRASGPFAQRGSGAKVPEDDMAAFQGDIAPARSTASFGGEEWGFEFRSERADTDRGYAQMGRTRNGAFL